MLLRVSLALLPASKLVFIQYLLALAVVEACRDENVLGSRGSCTRLKWPNDLYATVGPEAGDRKKIGGVLVNTSFSGGNVDIIVGKPYCSVQIIYRGV
jgi:biotin--protein ligase